ncbi:AEC family transporter [Terrihabitans sp. B22-R8]|uniref:AEC family transporter n=1 Tax=Terrihabitans sp. B22-R8 TaxID=3425128 RepID=UPI00403C18B0
MSTLDAVLPIFAIILAGFIGRRTGVLGPSASSELNRFVVWLGLPALLFSITSHASWADLYQPGITFSFMASCGVVFLAVVLVRLRVRGLAEASVDGLNGSYANTGYMGFPIALAVFGTSSLTGVTLLSIITVCVLFAAAILLIEVAVNKDQATGAMLFSVARSLVSNPLLIAPAAGILTSLLGLSVPRSADTFLKLLGAAASPCALVALGTFLADRYLADERSPRKWGVILSLSGVKLLVHPLLTYVFAHYVFDLPKMAVDLSVLMAALPTGTGPFMLAEYYDRDADVTADVILLSTLGSIGTVPLLLHLQGHGPLPL